jgi:beta-xylosidase
MPFNVPEPALTAGKEPAAIVASATAPWLADRGDGTYRNPVLFADYSDPDVVRVGDDYWMTSSSFNHVPGLPILHSRDLVNWTLVNHALPRLVPEKHFSIPRHGEGVWAPAIRYHAGNYWIFYPDPDFGLYVITATDPRGTWSSPLLVKAGKGLIDPCPFWDHDGTGYLVHGWAKSRAGSANRLTLLRLSADGTSVVDEGTVIIDASAIGWHTLEGPKLYRRGDYYYIFAPAGGVKHGYQAVFRARNIYGPYEHRVVLEQGSTSINGPHQGAWIETSAGEDWFVHFQDREAFGRVVHLQPMSWPEDGWPSMGTLSKDGRRGEPVLIHAKPAQLRAPVSTPPTSDEFADGRLGLQWQWEANPQPDWASLTARNGALRLACIPLEANRTLWSAGNLLLQKFPAPAFEITTAVDFMGAADGDRAGLIAFGYDYAWVGLRQRGGKVQLVFATCPEANQTGTEQDVAVVSLSGKHAELRVTVSAEARCTFAYRSGNEAFVSLPVAFHARPAKWVGAKVGLFASGNISGGAGYADFDWFRVVGRNE